MRLCILSDCVFPTPMSGGHGLGLMVWQIAEGLKARGHDVTLIAKEGSQFSGTLHTVPGAELYDGETLLARDAMRLHRSWPFDAFLDNGHLHILAEVHPYLPIVNVFHDMFQIWQRCPVLLSDGQKAMMPVTFDNARIIPNALPADAFTPLLEPFDTPFVLFLGAISEIKQPLLALEACARAGVNLVMAGGNLIGKFPAGAYEQVQVIGSVAGRKKEALLRNARVFLQLGTGESFGLTTLEANLSGTPVVAWPSGGSLDIIQYGVNGVFVPQGGEAVQAVADGIERAWDMDRTQVRAYAETLCNVDAQIDSYENALAGVIGGEWW